MFTIFHFFQNFEKVILRGSNWHLKIFGFLCPNLPYLPQKVKTIWGGPKIIFIQILVSDFLNNALNV